MSEELRKKASESYEFYEKKAQTYFLALSEQLTEGIFISNLKRDFKIWQKKHKKRLPVPSRISNNDYDNIQLLKLSGKLNPYLERSISYIYMRDLGKALNEKETRVKIQSTVDKLKKYLLDPARKAPDFISQAALYRWGEKEGVELTIIWLINKLNMISRQIPAGLDAGEARRKLIKIIAGVVIHQFDELDDNVSQKERTQKLDEAIRLGYTYGLTYPFIDDLLDSDVLTEVEKNTFTQFIRETLLTGHVPDLGDWAGPNETFIRFVHAELRSAFLYVKDRQSKVTSDHFFEVAYVFFEAQEADRVKDLSNSSYTNEELFIPVIIKSASSRLIARRILPSPTDKGFDARTFYYGIYNQLADDFTDLFSDLEARRVTPYTYYLTHHKNRPDLVNPFELYWTVISYLIHNVYDSHPYTREVILSRAINGQRRFMKRVGSVKYIELMGQLSFSKKAFNRKLKRMVQHAVDVEFFDKMLRDYIVGNNEKMGIGREDFIKQFSKVRDEINEILPIETNKSPLLEESITDAANYSLENGGKRLRPIMTWFLGVKEYSLDRSAIIPLLKSIEYMHTASLIFDDLPSQDDAPIRRGRPTLHHVYNSATAELTGLFLTQKAVSEQASLEPFNPEAVLKLIRYSSDTVIDVARGQAMDLGSKGKDLTIEQLNTICFYKTGIAFEASLVMPAILAERPEKEIRFLKKYAYHAGIAFQIKDDLLDVEGDSESLGKLAGIDTENNTASFVAVLGIDEAKKAMWEHYCLAMEELETQGHQSGFLKFFLDYIVQRES